MAKFCPNCGVALDPDAKFCPSCSSKVTVSGALASELREGVISLIQAPSLKVEPPIWAGVIQVLWILLALGNAFIYSGLAFVGGFATGAAGFLGQPGKMESIAVWAILYSAYCIIQLAFQIPLAFGFFAQKRWAYGLYLWSIGPIVLIDLTLKLASPSIGELAQKLPLSISMISTIGWILALGLVVLQIFLVFKSKSYLVH